MRTIPYDILKKYDIFNYIGKNLDVYTQYDMISNLSKMHEDKPFNAYFSIEQFTSGKLCCHDKLPTCQEDFTDDAFTFLSGYRQENMFVSLFSYTSKKRDHGVFRRSKNLFGCDYIMIDIDCKGAWAHDMQGDFLLDLIQNGWEYENPIMPEPDLITLSGSGGVHLGYAFEYIPQSAFGSVKKYFTLLCDAAERTLNMFCVNGIYTDTYGRKSKYNVDRHVCDRARLERLPGSINTKTGQYCINCLVHDPNEHRKSISECLAFFGVNDDIEKYRRIKAQIVQRKKENRKKKKQLAAKKASEKATNGSRLFVLLKNREEDIYQAVSDGKLGVGLRNNVLFLYDATLRSLGDSKEVRYIKLNELNSMFDEPLPQREIDDILNKTTTYKFTDYTFYDFLGLEHDCKKQPVCSKQPSDTKIKVFNNKTMISFYTALGYSISQIASKLKLSVSLVKKDRRLIKEEAKSYMLWLKKYASEMFIRLVKILYKNQGVSLSKNGINMPFSRVLLFDSILYSMFSLLTEACLHVDLHFNYRLKSFLSIRIHLPDQANNILRSAAAA